MRKAGVDFGLTAVKIHWIDDKGEDNYLSTREVSRQGLASVLRHVGVKDLCVAGNGERVGFEEFRHHEWPGDPIHAELRLQAMGARHLLVSHSIVPETKHVVIGIGTGMSFTFVNGGGFHFPVGSPYGAGSIDGLLSLIGLPATDGLDALLDGTDEIPSFDLPLGEAVPSLKETRYNDWIAASFVKARALDDTPDVRRIRAAKSVVQHLATDLASRLLIFDNIWECRGTREVILVGTLPHKSRYVRSVLNTTLRKIGKQPWFHNRGGYALAVGAYHSIDP